MNRLPPKRSSAIKNEPDANGQGPTSVAAEPSGPAGEGSARIPLGWRLAIIVWVCGFVGLFGIELWNLVWKLFVKS
jgi:hypothetical protein